MRLSNRVPLKSRLNALPSFQAFKRVSDATYWHQNERFNYSSGLVLWEDHKVEGCCRSSGGLLQLKAGWRQTGAFLFTSVTRLSSVGNIQQPTRFHRFLRKSSGESSN